MIQTASSNRVDVLLISEPYSKCQTTRGISMWILSTDKTCAIAVMNCAIDDFGNRPGYGSNLGECAGTTATNHQTRHLL